MPKTATETKILEAVQESKAALLAILPKEHHATKRRRGSEAPVTFEDATRCVIEEAGDLLEATPEDRELALKLAPALDVFQKAVNTAWTYTIETGMVRRVARHWYKRKVNMADRFEYEEVESEATFQARRHIIAFTPKASGTALETYLNQRLTRDLNEWLARAQSPVELPANVARREFGERSVTLEDAGLVETFADDGSDIGEGVYLEPGDLRGRHHDY